MNFEILGRTGLTVSVIGLGCGGSSRLGQGRSGGGASVTDSVRIVQGALDLGVNYFDTAQSYGTEDIVGRALASRRDDAVISTKVKVRPAPGGPRLDAMGLRRALEESLRRLRTESIDVFYLHGVATVDYAYCVSELAPELLSIRDDGAIRHLAISEQPDDCPHTMLQRATSDDCWDVVVVSFSVLNSGARVSVLPYTVPANIGVEVMSPVRRILGEDVDASLVEAAYRFVRHEPGCHVVLTVTGNLGHLRSNIRAINRPPLSAGEIVEIENLMNQGRPGSS